jgi:hypothetical protein
MINLSNGYCIILQTKTQFHWIQIAPIKFGLFLQNIILENGEYRNRMGEYRNRMGEYRNRMGK